MHDNGFPDRNGVMTCPGDRVKLIGCGREWIVSEVRYEHTLQDPRVFLLVSVDGNDTQILGTPRSITKL